MSSVLKAASAAAIAIYTIATLLMTDASAALASPDFHQPVTLETVSEPLDVTAPLIEPAPAASLADLVAAQPQGAPLDAETRCLASAVYFEAKGESLEGQLAVARVVLARRDSPRFPASLCRVVHQPRQFSFVRGGQMPAIRTQGRAWRRAVAIARIAQADRWESPVEGALFFHASHVSPGWRLQRIAAIDNHIFYR